MFALFCKYSKPAHSMKMIKSAAVHIDPSQNPVIIAVDQLLFALTKQIQCTIGKRLFVHVYILLYDVGTLINQFGKFSFSNPVTLNKLK